MGKFFFETLERERKNCDLRYIDIAEEVGVSKEFVVELESGMKKIGSLGPDTLSKQQIIKMASLLQIPPKKLYREDMNDTKIILISNNKGGSHKTTVSVNLAHSLSVLGKKILLVDTDEQENATHCFGLSSDGESENDYETYMTLIRDIDEERFKGLKNYIYKSPYNVDVVRGDPDSANMTAFMTTQLISPRSVVAAFEMLKKVGVYDYIIVDTDPSLDVAKETLLRTTDYVIIPTPARTFAVDGMNKLLSFLDNYRDQDERLFFRVLGIVKSGVNNSESQANEESLSYANEFEKLFKVVIPTDAKIERSQQHKSKKPVLAYDKKSKSGLAYVELAKEVMSRE